MRKIAESMGSRRIDMVFVVGGSGGNAGADAIQRECTAINVICSVIAMPKSIDNDLMLVSYYLQRLPFIVEAIQYSEVITIITFETVGAYQREASCGVRVIYRLPEVFCRLKGALALTQLLNNRSMLSWLQKRNHLLHIKVLVWSS